MTVLRDKKNKMSYHFNTNSLSYHNRPVAEDDSFTKALVSRRHKSVV